METERRDVSFQFLPKEWGQSMCTGFLKNGLKKQQVHICGNDNYMKLFLGSPQRLHREGWQLHSSQEVLLGPSRTEGRTAAPRRSRLCPWVALALLVSPSFSPARCGRSLLRSGHVQRCPRAGGAAAG